MKRGWMLLWITALLLLPWAARAEAVVKLDGRGAQIGLLREYETEWASLREELEAVSAQVGLSSEKVDGCVFTVDQVAASDGYLLVFFTLTSDKPFVRPQDASIFGRNADTGTGVFLEAMLSGVDGRLSAGVAGFNMEQFFRDDHTITGWGLLISDGVPVRIPEVCRVRLEASVGTGHLTPKGHVSFTLDRSAKLKGFYESDIDVPLVCTLPGDRGGERKLRFTHLSMSPLGNLLTLEEEVIGKGTSLVVFDESGRQVGSSHGGRYAYDNASSQNPVHEERVLAFGGGRDGQKLTLAPMRLTDDIPDAHLPIDILLPYTHTDEHGRKFTLLALHIDKNGMTVKYTTEVGWWVLGFDACDKLGEPIKKLGRPRGESHPDRGNGVETTTKRWIPQKGTKKGDRITQKTFDKIKTLKFSGIGTVPSMEYAVTIEIPRGDKP